MKIEWFSKSNNLGAITIYENNITLNKQAADFFVNSYCVAVGMDMDSRKIVIKSISKEEAENADEVERGHYHKLSVKKSYGRITGKQMIDEIKEVLKLDFNFKTAYKYSAKWNTGLKMLIVSTQEEGEKDA